MSGLEIKQMIVDNNLKLWQVAKEYGVTDSTFSRMLRYDFSEEKTAKITAAIQKLKRA